MAVPWVIMISPFQGLVLSLTSLYKVMIDFLLINL